MEEKTLITIKDLHKTYKNGDIEFEALKGININVNEGDFIGILGPSGSGKSTLMNVIGCMDTFTSGTYNFLGVDIDKMSDKQLTLIRNRFIGFIFQKYHLIEKYSVLQNVMVPLLARGMSYLEAEEHSIEKLKILGIESKYKNKPNQLSGGQQQRVAIARALVGNPKILLADEPTGALDVHTGKEVLKLFEELNEMGNTIIMITHDLSVATHAKKTYKIIDGELFDK